MQYYRCKCGKREAWGGMPPYPCTSCADCGTTLDTGPDRHRESRPHELRPTEVETDAGVAFLHRCTWCGETKKQIEAAGEKWIFQAAS